MAREGVSRSRHFCQRSYWSLVEVLRVSRVYFQREKRAKSAFGSYLLPPRLERQIAGSWRSL